MTTSHDKPTEQLSPLMSSRWTKYHPIFRFGFALIGLVLIAVGFVGWILPFLPGVPLVVLGVTLVAAGSRSCLLMINRIDRRLPLRARLALRLRSAKTRPDVFDTTTYFECPTKETTDALDNTT